MPNLLDETLSAQNLDEQPIMSLEALNEMRRRIVEEDFDPSAEEMAAAVQSIRPERTKDSTDKPKKARKESVKKKAEALSLDDLM